MQGEERSIGPDGGPAGLEKTETQHEAEEAPTVLLQEVICSPATAPSSMVSATSCSSLNGEEPFCRICHEGLSAGDLLSPCECAGTLAMVHRVCLEHWLTASGTSHCELCHFEFALERLPKPFTEWLATPSMQRRTLCGDVICFLFITPLASLSGWLCVQGALDLYYSNGMEAFGLLMLTLALFTIYLFWTVVSLRYHVHLFKSWRETNPRVRLQTPRPAQTPQRQQNLALHFLFKDKGKETVV
ncbi:E3 ubiquitin-protein ligase MARCHF3 [Astyanax mexicanus]|uniref:E3 ubiquitin-protein ligase MARCH3-like n=1 Tax=Astyanax mexicanus TaxID=7994 RepID=A0A8T2L3L7_ASTMX|nr:E3 ubiquitin-protein ligase MARCHF3 [Astyanax mexicanus]KAG9266548.1 E3 ubiquitin-protein ligase MARCH3-like [Astyanax mexicanus]